MCLTGKNEYGSAREAREAVAKFRSRPQNYNTGRRVKKNYKPQRVYKCDYCKKYHVTSKK